MRGRGRHFNGHPPENSLTKAFRRFYRSYKRRAERDGRYFELTEEQFNELTKKNCVYCDRPPSQKWGLYTYNGLDRLDNLRGYSLDNIAPCCWECNRIKGSSLSVTDMQILGPGLREIRVKKKPE